MVPGGSEGSELTYEMTLMEKELIHVLLFQYPVLPSWPPSSFVNRSQKKAFAVWLDHAIGFHGPDLGTALLNLLAWIDLQEGMTVPSFLYWNLASEFNWKLFQEGDNWDWDRYEEDLARDFLIRSFRPRLVCRLTSTSPSFRLGLDECM